ncbi:MAG: PfkB family carbohydrate kinase [Bacteroidales bacterium]|jgi:rfaE bifunctional protein kinase chain/domain|nr:PfkB family carbohydrate kinase [Bacteroidales bacterium]
MNIQYISAIDAYSAANNGALLLDVREELEVSDIWIDMDNIQYLPSSSLKELNGKIPRDREIIVCCAIGIASEKVAIMLMENSYENVSVLENGLVAWKLANLPLKSRNEIPCRCQCHNNKKNTMKIKKENVRKIFDNFSNIRVLIIGDVMLDDYITGDVTRISPEAPVPVLNIKTRYACLGGAANVALNIKSLGATPVLCSVIGKEKKSEDFLAIMKKENITDIGVIQSENRILTTKYRAIGNNMQLLRLDDEVTHPLSQQDKNNFLEVLTDIIHSPQKIDVIIFEDYDKGIITEHIIEKVVSLAQEKSIPVLVDPKKRNFQHYRNIDLFKPNWKELTEGLRIGNGAWKDEHLLEKVKQFMIEKQHKQLLLTLSGDGIVLYRYENNTFFSDHIPACLRNVTDVSGAGDTVISVAALCMVMGIEGKDMAMLSNLAGGLVCEEIGVVAVNKEKLIQEAMTTGGG